MMDPRRSAPMILGTLALALAGVELEERALRRLNRNPRLDTPRPHPAPPAPPRLPLADPRAIVCALAVEPHETRAQRRARERLARVVAYLDTLPRAPDDAGDGEIEPLL